MRICRALNDVLFRSSTHQNWPRDRKTQSCWCLHWFLGFRADVWPMRLHVYTRLVVTQVCIDKPCNKNIEIGFQNASLTPIRRWVVYDKETRSEYSGHFVSHLRVEWHVRHCRVLIPHDFAGHGSHKGSESRCLGSHRTGGGTNYKENNLNGCGRSTQ